MTLLLLLLLALRDAASELLMLLAAAAAAVSRAKVCDCSCCSRPGQAGGASEVRADSAPATEELDALLLTLPSLLHEICRMSSCSQ